MAELLLQRLLDDGKATLGALSLDGRFVCMTCEDERRLVKVPGETRIPAGRYHVTLRTEGGFHQRYSEKFPQMHKGMLWLREVPGFEYILIHVGNYNKDTEGCILVGDAPPPMDATNWVRSSSRTYVEIYPRLALLAASGELWITVKDCDHD